MKRLRFSGRSSTSQFFSHTLSSRPSIPFCQRCSSIRHNSVVAADSPSSTTRSTTSAIPRLPRDARQIRPRKELESYKSPPPDRALKSAKLASLHARLSLSHRIPLQALARALIDQTADPDPLFNNSALAVLGEDLLGYYCSEHLICKYPRLPIEVLWAAQRAYIGPEVLWNVISEWGIESVVAPGGEVDPGLLQFKRRQRTELHYEENHHARRREEGRQALLPASLRRGSKSSNDITTGISAEEQTRTTNTHKLLSGNQFGEVRSSTDDSSGYTTKELAASNLVRAVTALVHLYSGQSAAKAFFTNHFLSRSLDMSKLFHFDRPNRDLVLLCKREGFEVPVARLVSETGRLSAHPVFVVGVFSGRDKLGEGVGGSLPEAKTRAAVAALKSWYLYKPLEVSCPSETESADSSAKWKPNLVDCGEVVMY